MYRAKARKGLLSSFASEYDASAVNREREHDTEVRQCNVWEDVVTMTTHRCLTMESILHTDEALSVFSNLVHRLHSISLQHDLERRLSDIFFSDDASHLG